MARRVRRLGWNSSDTKFGGLKNLFPNRPLFQCKGTRVFAWGNPLVSDSSALAPTARQFIEWAENRGLIPSWVCVDEDMQRVLATELEWSSVTCIYEDVIDPEHVLYMTGPSLKGMEGAHAAKDLKKNLRRAEKADVDIEEVREFDWTDQERKEVEEGIDEWKKNKNGLQIASTTLHPWLDRKHRRYWLAKQGQTTIGVLILTPIRNDWQIKNAISFPNAPRGTSEKMIFTVLRDLYNEEVKKRHLDPNYHDLARVTFGISASKRLEVVNDVSGWGMSVLSKTYNGLASAAGLLRRGEFRGKFDTDAIPRYVCFPYDKFGVDTALALIKSLKN
ncbi:hypothetical protein F5887DRAFT_1068299 [Amanita rubescens]|nr:hypothetical protein F5887DRAFT_1068299 [Amanita rubescens]